ncbi:MAG: TatD family hydrolase [Candidatus Latescibacterota bacterium]
MMIDSHCHLNDKSYKKDFDAVLARAAEAGVSAMINVGFDLASSVETAALAEKYSQIYGVVGVHPHDAASYNDHVERELSQLLGRQRILGIGEIGLDFYRDLSPRHTQREVFRRQLALANEHAKPVIIHCRDAFDDVMSILQAEGGNYRGIFHAFSGDVDMARQILSLGFYLGIGGVVTYANSRLKRAVGELPAKAIVLETDCPYLTPHPFRGKRNEPAYLTYIVDAIAGAQGVCKEDVIRSTRTNLSKAVGLEQKRKPTIVYKIRNSLYINMTNRCTNRCTFCAREEDPTVRGHFLGMAREPSAAEILQAVGDPGQYDEVVFCGFGEPTLRLSELKEVARALKDRGGRVRVNTNGLGALIWKRNLAEELKELVDVVSVSLNASTNEQYMRLCKPSFGEKAFPAMLEFVRKCVDEGLRTICTAVNHPQVDVKACEELARSLGAEFRVRKYDVVG